MIIVLEKEISTTEINNLRNQFRGLGYDLSRVDTSHGSYLIAIGNKEIDPRKIGFLPGVKDIYYVDTPYQLVSKMWKVQRTMVHIAKGLTIGEDSFQIIAGPCSVESEFQIETTASFLSQKGMALMRGGVFKPRSSPYSFQGLGLEGLQMFRKIAQKHKLAIVSEVMKEEQIELMAPHVDIFQVGARNAQNFSLLKELGKINKPVILKRGLSMSLDELLQSAEYIFSNGNESIILCERGVRSFENAYRNMLDLNSVPVLKEKTHLPVIVDPSHGIGIRRHVNRMCYSAIMAGADGLLVEIHPQPEKALSDGFQSLNFYEFEILIKNANQLLRARQQLADYYE
ncbi:MAG: 3-deoxy-7-phosphoheptulonate synthase [Calditrichia bacterium]